MNPSNADTRLAHLSALLLETYQLAREEPIERFHDTVLDCLTAALPFEKAWWGRAALTPEGPFEQSSHLYGLPRDYLDDWLAIRAEDITVQRSHAHPGHAVVIDTQRRTRREGCACSGKARLRRIPVHRARRPDHAAQRRPEPLPSSRCPAVRAGACRLLECVMPHLAAAVALRTGVEDPMLDFLRIQQPSATFHAFQRTLIDDMARALDL